MRASGPLRLWCPRLRFGCLQLLRIGSTQVGHRKHTRSIPNVTSRAEFVALSVTCAAGARYEENRFVMSTTTEAAATPGTAAPGSNSLLTVSHLTRRYGSNTAVNDVSFSLGPEITGLLGPN